MKKLLLFSWLKKINAFHRILNNFQANYKNQGSGGGEGEDM